MSAKDNAAVIRLFDLLESRYALRVIWALSDGHPQTFRLLQDSVGGVTPNTLNTRLKELRAARLVDHAGEGYRLTSQGADLARRLLDVQQFAPKWSQQQARAAANAAASTPIEPARPAA
ncbi:winged helix-turn-helix transcriptional regulator [Hydrogenophaga sp.]|uniref:winged helix-turn-helix transcriptional regulator n=1 Tax=Hydrogenophaga sp. TaxID=1904254 RepID=UPI003F6D1351